MLPPGSRLDDLGQTPEPVSSTQNADENICVQGRHEIGGRRGSSQHQASGSDTVLPLTTRLAPQSPAQPSSVGNKVGKWEQGNPPPSEIEAQQWRQPVCPLPPSTATPTSGAQIMLLL